MRTQALMHSGTSSRRVAQRVARRKVSHVQSVFQATSFTSCAAHGSQRLAVEHHAAIVRTGANTALGKAHLNGNVLRVTAEVVVGRQKQHAMAFLSSPQLSTLSDDQPFDKEPSKLVTMEHQSMLGAFEAVSVIEVHNTEEEATFRSRIGTQGQFQNPWSASACSSS